MKFEGSREQMVGDMRLALREELRLALLPSVRLVMDELLQKLRAPEKPTGVTHEAALMLEDVKCSIRKLHSHWLTRREAADYCKCSISHIDDLASANQFRRFDGPRYLRLDLDKCIQEGRFTSKAKKAAGKEGQ